MNRIRFPRNSSILQLAVIADRLYERKIRGKKHGRKEPAVNEISKSSRKRSMGIKSLWEGTGKKNACRWYTAARIAVPVLTRLHPRDAVNSGQTCRPEETAPRLVRMSLTAYLTVAHLRSMSSHLTLQAFHIYALMPAKVSLSSSIIQLSGPRGFLSMPLHSSSSCFLEISSNNSADPTSFSRVVLSRSLENEFLRRKREERHVAVRLVITKIDLHSRLFLGIFD